MSDYLLVDATLAMFGMLKPEPALSFLLHSDATFNDIHEAIMSGTRFQSYHLHAFVDVQSNDYICGLTNPAVENDWEDDKQVVVRSHLNNNPPKTRFGYLYDFGDDWQFTIEVELVRAEDHLTAAECKRKYLRKLIKNEGDWPIEDCGGVPGFVDLLELIQKKKAGKKLTADEKELLEWSAYEPAKMVSARSFNRLKKTASQAKKPKRRGIWVKTG